MPAGGDPFDCPRARRIDRALGWLAVILAAASWGAAGAALVLSYRS